MATNATQNVSTAVPQMSTTNNQMSTATFLSTTTGNASVQQVSGGDDSSFSDATLLIIIPILVICFGTGVVVYCFGVFRKLRFMWHKETRDRRKAKKAQAAKQRKKEAKQKRKGIKKKVGSKKDVYEKGLQDIQEEDEDLPVRPVKESHVRVGRKMVDMLVIEDLPEPRKEDIFMLTVQTPPGVVPDTSETAEERRLRRKNAWANSRKWAADYNKRRDDQPVPPTRGSTAAAARVRPSERRDGNETAEPPPTRDSKQRKTGRFMRAIGRMTGRRQQQSLIEEEEIASRGGTPPHVMPTKETLSLAERASLGRQGTAASRQPTAASRMDTAVSSRSRDVGIGARRASNRKADNERANQERQQRRQRAEESRGHRDGRHHEDIEEFEA